MFSRSVQAASFASIALTLAIGCGKTRAEAILAMGPDASVDAGSDAGPGPGLCQPSALVAPGSYRFRALASQKCLAVGDATTVLQVPAHASKMVEDCTRSGVFQLILDTSVSGTFQVRDPSSGDALDIETAATSDGTRVLFFPPQGQKNQKFYFVDEGANTFEIKPAHAPQSCISDASPQPEIFACGGDRTDQLWELLPAACP